MSGYTYMVRTVPWHMVSTEKGDGDVLLLALLETKTLRRSKGPLLERCWGFSWNVRGEHLGLGWKESRPLPGPSSHLGGGS